MSNATELETVTVTVYIAMRDVGYRLAAMGRALTEAVDTVPGDTHYTALCPRPQPARLAHKVLDRRPAVSHRLNH